MELELEQEMGPGCSDLHQARCKVQAMCLSVLLHNMEISTAAFAGAWARPVNRGPSSSVNPVPPRRGHEGCAANQRPWNESKLQRKHAAAFHTGIHCFDAHCSPSSI